MLTYPILELWFCVVSKIPWVIAISALAIWIVLSFFGHDEIRNAIIAIIVVPTIAFGICYGCKIGQELFPIIGWMLIIVRLIVDALLLRGIIMIIRYFTIK